MVENVSGAETELPEGSATLSEIAEVIGKASTFAVSGHINPDGDTIGSVLGIVALLKGMGKEVTPLLANASSAPEKYAFLDGYSDFVHATKFSKRVDVYISVDTPTVERMGDAREAMKRAGTSISLDHHPESGVGANLSRRDISSASASMMVWELAKHLTDGHPGKDVATACYTGIVTDTGCFQFQNTDSRALMYAYEMVAEGAVPSDVCEMVYHSRRPAALRLESQLISRIQLTSEGTVAWAWISEHDYDKLGACKEDTEGLVDRIREVGGIEVAMLIQGRRKDVRCSIRAKHGFDVSKIAHEYGGGGHRAASGFTLPGRLPDNMDRISSMVEEIEAKVLAWRAADGDFSEGTK